jgi:hypothetical protein
VKTLDHERIHVYQLKTFGAAASTETASAFDPGSARFLNRDPIG